MVREEWLSRHGALAIDSDEKAAEGDRTVLEVGVDSHGDNLIADQLLSVCHPRKRVLEME